MKRLSLLQSSGSDSIDEILRGVVGAYEAAFPNRIRGYYLTGSFVDGTAGPESDIDLCVLFKDSLAEEEETAADRLAESCSARSEVELDIVALAESVPYPMRAVSLKLASLPIYGEDVRDRIPLPAIDAYRRQAADVALGLLARARGCREVPVFPLEYPEPDGEFYGYDRNGKTKGLVLSTGLIATVRIAFQAGCYVAGKRECVTLYRTHIGDEWTGFLEEVYDACRRRWVYRVPERREDRGHLRELCRRKLAFENHFLQKHVRVSEERVARLPGEDEGFSGEVP